MPHGVVKVKGKVIRYKIKTPGNKFDETLKKIEKLAVKLAKEKRADRRAGLKTSIALYKNALKRYALQAAEAKLTVTAEQSEIKES